MGSRALAQQERLSRTTVRRWLARFLVKRCAGLHDRPRSGRPTVITPTARALVVALACELPAERNVPLSRYSLSELSMEVAWDVYRAVVFGRCEPKTGKAAFGRLVDDVMSHEPYRSARRVFWVVDNGSSHRGERAAAELRERHPRVVMVHTPVHASWLNQVEIYFSIIQRKVLTPNDCATLDELIERIHAFGRRYSTLGKPFAWRFTRQDLERRLRDPLLKPELVTSLAQVA